MSEQFDPEVAESVLWLVNKVRESSAETSKHDEWQVCKLNDFSSFEMSQLIQAMDSEDRI